MIKKRIIVRMENTELEKILYRVDRTRDQNSFCNENNYYAAHECQFLLTYYLNKFIGTQKQFLSTHKIDHKLKIKEDEVGLTQQEIWEKKYK